MKTYFTLISIVFLLFGCITNEDNLYSISTELIIKDQDPFKNLVESIEYIALDNKTPLNKIKNIAADEEQLILNCLTNVFFYNLNGNYIREIGKKGKGPGEYKSNKDIAIDKGKKYVYILDRKKTHLYSYAGKYIRTLNNPEKLRFDRLIVKESKLYYFKGFGLGKLQYEWIITDDKGNIIKKKQNYLNESNIIVSYSVNLCFQNNENIFYWNQLNDTITQIEGITYTPKYLFASDKYRLTSDDLSSINNFRKKQSWQPTKIIGSERYLFINYILQKEQRSIHAFYDGQKNKFYETNSLELTIKDRVECNFWDNGIIINPEAKFIINKAYLFIQWIDAYQLKAHVASEAFKNSTPKYPDKKKALEKLANNLNENDNPVLMLVKLKE